MSIIFWRDSFQNQDIIIVIKKVLKYIIDKIIIDKIIIDKIIVDKIIIDIQK